MTDESEGIGVFKSRFTSESPDDLTNKKVGLSSLLSTSNNAISNAPPQYPTIDNKKFQKHQERQDISAYTALISDIYNEFKSIAVEPVKSTVSIAVEPVKSTVINTGSSSAVPTKSSAVPTVPTKSDRRVDHRLSISQGSSVSSNLHIHQAKQLSSDIPLSLGKSSYSAKKKDYVPLIGTSTVTAASKKNSTVTKIILKENNL